MLNDLIVRIVLSYHRWGSRRTIICQDPVGESRLGHTYDIDKKNASPDPAPTLIPMLVINSLKGLKCSMAKVAWVGTSGQVTNKFAMIQLYSINFLEQFLVTFSFERQNCGHPKIFRSLTCMPWYNYEAYFYLISYHMEVWRMTLCYVRYIPYELTYPSLYE